MNRALPALLVLLTALVAILLASRWSRERDWDADRVYAEYDRNFRAYLANATRLVGEETIKVERLSERFTVPQKLTIQGTPYDVGLTIGHIGRQAGVRLPAVADTDRSLNQKVADLYRRMYPQDLELVR